LNKFLCISIWQWECWIFRKVCRMKLHIHKRQSHWVWTAADTLENRIPCLLLRWVGWVPQTDSSTSSSCGSLQWSPCSSCSSLTQDFESICFCLVCGWCHLGPHYLRLRFSRSHRAHPHPQNYCIHSWRVRQTGCRWCRCRRQFRIPRIRGCPWCWILRCPTRKCFWGHLRSTQACQGTLDQSPQAPQFYSSSSLFRLDCLIFDSTYHFEVYSVSPFQHGFCWVPLEIHFCSFLRRTRRRKLS